MENYEAIDAHNVPLADADDIEIIGVWQGVPRLDLIENMDIDAIANNDSDDDLPPIGPLYQANIDDEDEGHLRAFHPSIYVARILSNIDTQDEYTLVSRHDLQDLLYLYFILYIYFLKEEKKERNILHTLFLYILAIVNRINNTTVIKIEEKRNR